MVRKTRDGMLCEAHRTSGAPVFYYPGCEMCEHARAELPGGKGIIRPLAPPGHVQSKARLINKRHVDKGKLAAEHKARRAFMMALPFPREP